ncbi:MAG: chemotaxis protein CheW [Acidobacteriota bacterium]|nr:chemotaxis protein CheW [Acidobacteriota bacterium]
MSGPAADAREEPVAVERLRREFDDAFAEPWEDARRPQIRYLGVRCGQRWLAIDVSQLLTFHSRGEVVPLPTSLPQLLGLSSVEGKLYPCYSLAELLSLEARRAHWLLLCREAPVALAVEEVVGLFLVDAESEADLDEAAADSSPDSPRRRKPAKEARGGSPITGRIQYEGQEFSVLSISAVLEDLRELIGEERT